MPAFAAHSLFGTLVLNQIPPSLARLVCRGGAAFDYGLFGPDVLFFSDTVWKKGRSLNSLGIRMHQEAIREQFTCLFDWAASLSRQEGREQALSYAAGYLCHYRLDSAVHPYVYALCGDSHTVHNRIESDFDTLLWTARTGKPISAYRVRPAAPSKVIQAARRTAASLFQAEGAKVYGKQAGKAAVLRAFGEMEFCSRRMFSQGKAIAVLCSAADRLTHAGAGAFLRQIEPDSSVLNEAHREWENPFTGALSRQSYAELEEEAACLAAADVTALYSGRRTVPELTFSGAPLENDAESPPQSRA